MTSGAERVLHDAAFPALKQAAIGLTGMAYWSDKEVALAEVLARLLTDRRMAPSLLARRLAVESGRGPETDALVSTVTVGETSFFRYREQFAALEKVVVPERLHANRRFHCL
jgi:chemotaxis protein methyltransferase CheR